MISVSTLPGAELKQGEWLYRATPWGPEVVAQVRIDDFHPEGMMLDDGIGTKVQDDGTKRSFSSGANRDTAQDKPDYEGFLSPLVIERFGAYMHKNRHMRDGSLRDSDNWQKGMPLSVYVKSAFRHFVAWWKLHRGVGHYSSEEMEEALCGLLFNTQGYLHELLRSRGVK